MVNNGIIIVVNQLAITYIVEDDFNKTIGGENNNIY